MEHTVAGVVLVSVPLLMNSIPASWQNLTIGAALGLVWGFLRTYVAAVS